MKKYLSKLRRHEPFQSHTLTQNIAHTINFRRVLNSGTSILSNVTQRYANGRLHKDRCLEKNLLLLPFKKKFS